MCRTAFAVGWLAVWLLTVPASAGDPLVVDLWPGKVPGDIGINRPETSRIHQSPLVGPTKLITGVSKPTLTIYQPDKSKNTGTAMVICPGGGYWDLYWELEGEEVAAWLNARGMTGIILKYRCPRRPGEVEREPPLGPQLDAQRAVRLVRSRAAEWGINPRRIGIVGFSAGGHLAVATAAGSARRLYEPIDAVDSVSCRPDFAIACYPGYLKPRDRDGIRADLKIPADTPAIFLAHTSDDNEGYGGSISENSVFMYLALKRAGIPTELHVYATGDHDFGVRQDEKLPSTWTRLCVSWLRSQALLGPPIGSAGEAAYPLAVSENHRYFVNERGEPVFWLGTTQWQLFRDNTPEDARTIIQNVKGKGFAFIQVMLFGPGDGTRPNVDGEKPWAQVDPLTPNEAYFKNVDAAVRCARENNVVISMTLYHQRWRKLIKVENARAWARWLSRRYKDVPTIVWSMTPEAKPEFLPVLRELAAGLREGDGGSHLITFKPDPAPYSSSFAHGEKWLDFDSMQTWRTVSLIYPMVTKDYQMKPVKPVLMAEGAYEAGSEYGFDVSPLWTRRQAYYSYLSGAHFTYGHNDSWRVLPTWKKALDAPGAVQMGILKNALMGRKEWWHLVPDQTVFASGGKTDGEILNLAARHKDSLWVMAYLGSKGSFSIHMDKLTGGKEANASWIDPRTGRSAAIGTMPNTGVKEFSTPDGWEDALLVLESPPERGQP